MEVVCIERKVLWMFKDVFHMLETVLISENCVLFHFFHVTFLMLAIPFLRF